MLQAFMVNGIPNAIVKGCFDCFFCQAAVSWWCINHKAIKFRGTHIPGIVGCSFWEPMETLKQDGGDYIEISA